MSTDHIRKMMMFNSGSYAFRNTLLYGAEFHVSILDSVHLRYGSTRVLEYLSLDLSLSLIYNHIQYHYMSLGRYTT